MIRRRGCSDRLHHTAGGAALHLVSAGGNLRCIADTRSAFESVRGTLLDRDGGAVSYATPRDGQLGIFTGPNPVSINSAGQLAIRIELADGRQLMIAADPRG